MKVMLLAAGQGERMRPLTDHTPKPMLQVAGVPLLEHHIRRLVAAGFCELVVNVSHLAQQIVDYFGDGGRWGANIAWSHEQLPLETAGGIVNALPLLGTEPFVLVNGDVWTDYPFADLRRRIPRSQRGAYLVLVDNPSQHPRGDFILDAGGQVGKLTANLAGLTYAGLGVYRPGFFSEVPAGKFPLRPLMNLALEQSLLEGEYYGGEWVDVGTPDRLKALDAVVRSSRPGSLR